MYSRLAFSKKFQTFTESGHYAASSDNEPIRPLPGHTCPPDHTQRSLPHHESVNGSGAAVIKRRRLSKPNRSSARTRSSQRHKHQIWCINWRPASTQRRSDLFHAPLRKSENWMERRHLYWQYPAFSLKSNLYLTLGISAKFNMVERKRHKKLFILIW